MTNISKSILDKAFDIGFTIQTHHTDNLITVPCKATLKNGQSFEIAELIFLDNLYKPEFFKTYDINEVDYIDDSIFGLSLELRTKSLNVQEFRNDWPFFLRKKDNTILGYNASSPVNFTYDGKTLGKDIIDVVPFDIAQNEKFEFIKNHIEIPVKILCGKNEELLNKITMNFYR